MSRDQQKTQKDQGTPIFTEDEARAYFESRRWPDGAFCPHCASVNVYRMKGDTIRAGLFACRDCRGHFTVTVGTVMEDSHLSLAKWALAFHLMTSSKKGISALQLQRNLGLGSYKTAWHLAHRIREAMKCEPLSGKLSGDVQVDESYVGADRTKVHHVPKGEKPRKRGRGTDKTPVLVLVETDGKAHSHPIANVKADTLKAAMEQVIHPSARIVTDELASYPRAAAGFAGGHSKVCHRKEEYVNAEGLHTNTAESYFALLKRGVHGTFHHISPRHLHRYCTEFSFRWNGREMSDTDRRHAAVDGAAGKRLMFKMPNGG